MNKSRCLGVIGAILLSGQVMLAHAVPITFIVSGQVTTTIGPPIQIGDAVTLTYTFESATPDSNPGDITLGQYDAVTASSLTINGEVWNGVSFFDGIDVYNNNSTYQDYYRITQGTSGISINGYDPISYRMYLSDPTGAAHSDDSLLLTPPNPTAYSNKGISLEFYTIIDDGFGGFIDIFEYITASVDSISVSSVPIPPAVWLFGSGLLGLIGITRRKTFA